MTHGHPHFLIYKLVISISKPQHIVYTYRITTRYSQGKIEMKFDQVAAGNMVSSSLKCEGTIYTDNGVSMVISVFLRQAFQTVKKQILHYYAVFAVEGRKAIV
jgi:hypothetical protein